MHMLYIRYVAETMYNREKNTGQLVAAIEPAIRDITISSYIRFD